MSREFQDLGTKNSWNSSTFKKSFKHHTNVISRKKTNALTSHFFIPYINFLQKPWHHSTIVLTFKLYFSFLDQNLETFSTVSKKVKFQKTNTCEQPKLKSGIEIFGSTPTTAGLGISIFAKFAYLNFLKNCEIIEKKTSQKIEKKRELSFHILRQHLQRLRFTW